MSKRDWQDEVLTFWFEELTSKDWFGGGPELDERIRTRFADLPDEIAKEVSAGTQTDPRRVLAAVIALDQFPRNMHRGTAEAFALDAIAVGQAREAVDAELDSTMSATERQFLYMPFMHSEIMADQERCVALFRSLANKEGLDYAIEHRDIIARFGRFPHRNKALGRTNTPDEIEFLKTHKGFGQ